MIWLTIPGRPEPLAVLGGEDRDAAAAQPLDLLGHDHAAAPAVHLDVGGAALGQELDEVLEVLHVAALVRRHRDALGVLLQDRVDDLLDRAVVPEVDHLGALRLQDPPHDVDRRVVAVEQARGGDEADRVGGDVQLGHGDPSARAAQNSLMSKDFRRWYAAERRRVDTGCAGVCAVRTTARSRRPRGRRRPPELLQQRGQAAGGVGGEAGVGEDLGVEPGGGALDDLAAGVGDGGVDDAAVGLAPGPQHVALCLEAAHGAGDAGGVHLQQRADPGHRQLAARGEGEQAEHLVACEGQVEGPQHGVDARVDQLVHADQRGHHRHAVGGLGPAVRLPLAAGLADRVDWHAATVEQGGPRLSRRGAPARPGRCRWGRWPTGRCCRRAARCGGGSSPGPSRARRRAVRGRCR